MPDELPMKDLFGNTVEEVRQTPDPYARPAYGYQTCWEDCLNCGDVVFGQSHKSPDKRAFTVCSHPALGGQKCYESTPICQYFSLKKKHMTDWADY